MPACLEVYAQFGVSIFWTHAKDTFVRGIWYVVVLLGVYGDGFVSSLYILCPDLLI